VAEDIVQLDQIIGTNRTQNKMQENTGREDHLQRDFQTAANTANLIYVVMQTWNLLIFILAGFVMYRYKNKDGRGHALRTYVVVMSSFLGILWTFIARSTMLTSATAITEIYYHRYLAMVGRAEGQDLTAPATAPSSSAGNEDATRWTEIRWENVSFRYTETSPVVFSDLDWTIPARSRWILEGPSGRGKSTILKLLMRFYTPSSGKILLDGQSVDSIEVRRLRRDILYVNQDTPLFNKTILDNIRNSNHEITYDHVRDTLVKYRLLGILAEEKQETQEPLDAGAILSRSCGVDGKNLSKGQQKIISLSRSMIHVPLSTQVLLLDEPLASLDPQSRQGVLRWIGDLLEQRPDLTVVMTTHVMEDQEWVRRHRFHSIQPWR
jgi:ABC-type multidrug transport system fused ATPase/permease subunit